MEEQDGEDEVLVHHWSFDCSLWQDFSPTLQVILVVELSGLPTPDMIKSCNGTCTLLVQIIVLYMKTLKDTSCKGHLVLFLC